MLSINNIKISEVLSDRIKLAKKISKSIKRYAKCKCCGLPIGIVRTISINNYSPLCFYCYNDPEVGFEDMIVYYTTKGTWPHENFTDLEIDKTIECLIKEVQISSKLSEKHKIFIAKNRNLKFKRTV